MKRKVPSSYNYSDRTIVRNYRYDVFMSFSGAVTSISFVHHLYRRLMREGFSVAMHGGGTRQQNEDSFDAELSALIYDSRLSIIVFSNDYAASTRCLDELVAVADCLVQSDQIVFPVFYYVDPSHVRHQNGPYENAFVLHRQDFIQDPDKVRRWEKAMRLLSNIAGFQGRNKPQFELIEDIYQAVKEKLGGPSTPNLGPLGSSSNLGPLGSSSNLGLLGCQPSSSLNLLSLGNIASSSSNSIQNHRYDVFISFRGLDTRNTFVDHLYAHLIRKGIFVFKDDKRLHKGESISTQLLQAIQDSRLSIIVFSENYASSTWCLDEMAAIADCKQQANQIVFPVFYDVDPSDVRYQTGVYENAFALHRKRLKHHTDKVNRWENAMTSLANSAGWHVRNKAEFEEVKNIVQAVIKALGHTFSVVADDLIGIQSRVQALESILKLSSQNNDVRVLGIWGMNGIGKTTHATVLYDRISSKFDASCFIQNVNKIYRDGGATAIQKQILRQTLDEENLEMCDPLKISRIIQNRLPKIKVLIVLDNVNQIEQLMELVIDPKMLFTGSIMIITTTDEQILKLYGADVIHKVSLLNNNDAHVLFYRKAFKSEEQNSSCVELIPEVLKYAQCLPLAIKVIGSFLYSRDAIQWRDTLHRFEKNPDKKIMDVLQVSVDGLQGEEKEIFLHIACFFNEEREDYVKRILECCGLHPHIGIPRIMEKSLITLRDQEIHMHDMLQELGKKIVREQFLDEPGSWSRIWLCKDFFRILTTKKGTDKVKAIVLNKKEDIFECNVDGLSKLKNLRLLILYHKSFSGSLDFLSQELRYLLWHDYPFASLPSSFAACDLVELNMPNSSIKHVWEGRKNFPCLKRMDLSNSKNLIETPDFSGIPKLERLDLSGCTNLLQVHPSIGLVENLAFLSLRNCSNLVSINIGSESNLSSLKVLHLSGCTKLEKIPDFTSATNLEYLDMMDVQVYPRFMNLLETLQSLHS